MKKSCSCENIVIEFANDIGFQSARKCSCDYCSRNNAEYVSNPKEPISFEVIDKAKRKIITHGYRSAEFHECVNCGLVLVTSTIEGATYCVLNAKVLGIKGYTLDQEARDFSAESIETRQARRKSNWSPVQD